MPIINLVYEAPERKREPWANTLIYYPLNWDANDYSGNNRNLSASNISYQDLTGGKKSAYFNGSSSFGYIYSNVTLQNFTMNIWVKKSRNVSWERIMSYFVPNYPNSNEIGIISNWTWVWNVWSISYQWWWNSASWKWWVDTWTANLTWMNIAIVSDENWNKLYKNWEQLTLSYDNGDASHFLSSSYTFTVIFLWRHTSWSDFFQWNLSNCILEDRWWSKFELKSYYNQTKSNYWL